MPAVQARRRASPAERAWSVSRWAALRAPARTVWSMVTTTVAAVLVCRWSVGRCSRSSAKASPRRCRQSNDRSPGGGAFLAHPSGSSHRVDDLAEHRCSERGDGEVSGGGAVAVVVQGQGALLARCLLFGADELVLVGVDDLLVGFDGLDRPTGDPAELVGTEPGRLRHQLGLHNLTLFSGDTGGIWPVARTITAAWSGETSPASRASAVASCPMSSSSAPLSTSCLATSIAPVNPASVAIPAESAAAPA